MDKDTLLLTVKSRFGDDLRRFSLHITATYEQLEAQLRKSYHLGQVALLIKYADDEGDQISITSTEELSEAFRLMKDVKPPILHINVFEVRLPNQTPAAAIAQAKQQTTPQPKEEEKKIEPAPVVEIKQRPEEVSEEVDTSSEYPPLPVSEWAAPTKQKRLEVIVQSPPISVSTITVSEPIVQASIPFTISAQTQHNCSATAREVEKLAQETSQHTVSSANGAMYSDLAEQMAKQCIDLSRKTATLCEQLAKTQTQSTLKTGVSNPEIQKLSLQISQDCERLGKQTAVICNDLANATTRGTHDICVQISRQTTSSQDRTNQMKLSELSQQTSGQCAQLSSATVADSIRASSEIRRLVMGL